MTNRNDEVIREAITRGLLDATIVEASKLGHPWPVVVLTAFGSLLAALPICGLFALAFAKGSDGTELYVLGCVVLASAAAMLHIRRQALFFEYLNVCLLGSGMLMLWIPRSAFSAEVICALAAMATAITVPQPWIRALCGALMAFMLNTALSRHDANTLMAHLFVANSWYLTTFAWLAAHALLRMFERHARYALAAQLEAVLIGSGAISIVMLCYLSGQTFMLSQILPDRGWLTSGDASAWPLYTPAMLSTGCTLAAGVWLVRAKLFDWRWLGMALPPLALMSWFADSLGALSLIAVACVLWRRSHLAKLAGGAALWAVGALYYALDWPLLYKAMLLLLTAALLLLASRWGRGATMLPEALRPEPAVREIEKRWTKAALIAPAVMALVIVNVGILQKEQVIRQGKTVFVALAPVDPRSLMQGDYMALDFALPAELNDTTAASRLVVARRAKNGIATVTHFYDGSTLLENGEFLIEVQRREKRNVLVTDAWHFEEGDAERWVKARFGEFRVDRSGKAVLVGLRGASLEKL